MAKIGVGSLPEVNEVGDDDILLCSTDNRHVQKVKAKNVKGNGGGGSGGLAYWKETNRAFYKDTDTDPTEMSAVIVRKEGGLIDGKQWDYYEVFGHKFGFQVADPEDPNYESLEEERKFVLRRAYSMAMSSTDGHYAQPSDYTMPNVYSETGTDHYTSQYQSTLPNGFNPFFSASVMEENMSNYNFRYYYPGKNKEDYKAERASIYCGYITLDMYNSYGDICSSVNPGETSFADSDQPLGYIDTSLDDNTWQYEGRMAKRTFNHQVDLFDIRGYKANIARNTNYGNYDHKDVRFLWFLTCQGKAFASGDDPDDYTLDTTETASYGMEASSFKKVSGPLVPDPVYELVHEYPHKMDPGDMSSIESFRDRTRNMSCTFVDDNGVKWSFSIGFSPDITVYNPYGTFEDFPLPGTYEITYPDFTLPNGVKPIDLGYVPHHPCYYEGANPVDVNGELSDASHEVYKQNIIELAKAVKSKLGLKSTPAVLEGEIPGGISYKVKTELVNDDNNLHRSYSAGTMDGEGNYTETVGVDPIAGDILLKGQSIKQMIAGSVDVEPILDQGTKIAIINQHDIFAPTPPVVEGNPQDTGSTDLEKLKINNDVYNIKTGGGTDYSVTPVKVGKWIDGTTDVYEAVAFYEGYANYRNIDILDHVADTSEYNRIKVLEVGGTIGHYSNNKTNIYPMNVYCNANTVGYSIIATARIDTLSGASPSTRIRVGFTWGNNFSTDTSNIKWIMVKVRYVILPETT